MHHYVVCVVFFFFFMKVFRWCIRQWEWWLMKVFFLLKVFFLSYFYNFFLICGILRSNDLRFFYTQMIYSGIPILTTMSLMIFVVILLLSLYFSFFNIILKFKVFQHILYMHYYQRGWFYNFLLPIIFNI